MPLLCRRNQDESGKCHFCGEFLAPVMNEEEKQGASINPETKPQQEPQTPSAGKPEAGVEITEVLAEKTAGIFEKPTQTVRKKKDWILIIAIIVFGILLLVIQFSKQLGIEGFP